MSPLGQTGSVRTRQARSPDVKQSLDEVKIGRARYTGELVGQRARGIEHHAWEGPITSLTASGLWYRAALYPFNKRVRILPVEVRPFLATFARTPIFEVFQLNSTEPEIDERSLPYGPTVR